MQELGRLALDSAISRFRALKELGEGAMVQLDDEELHWTPDPETNSFAVIMQHLNGNMLSRWTEFLTSDGEKPDRERDAEFTPHPSRSRLELMNIWDEGWNCLFTALNALVTDDLPGTILIRGQTLSVIDAIHRQLSHYAYHVGQIVQLAKLRKGTRWQTLSIPRGRSKELRAEAEGLENDRISYPAPQSLND